MIGKTDRRQSVWLATLLIGLLFVAVSGCGKEPFATIPVSGKVTYEDGSLIPAKQIRLEFIPQAEPVNAKLHPRPGTTYVNVADGTFAEVTSHKFADGLVVGKHKVVVVSLDDKESQTDVVPKLYQRSETTPLEIEVGPETKTLELKVKKQ